MNARTNTTALNCLLVFCTSAGFSLASALGISLVWRSLEFNREKDALAERAKELETDRDFWRREFFQLEYQTKKLMDYNYQLGLDLERLRNPDVADKVKRKSAIR